MPAALIVGAIAWAYIRFGALPAVAGLLYGIKPVIIAVVAQALWGLGRTAIKTPLLAMVGLAAVVAAARRPRAGGACGVRRAGRCHPSWRQARDGRLGRSSWWPGAGASVASPRRRRRRDLQRRAVALFLFFLKVGSVLFGSGYVLLAFLRADLVERSAG